MSPYPPPRRPEPIFDQPEYPREDSAVEPSHHITDDMGRTLSIAATEIVHLQLGRDDVRFPVAKVTISRGPHAAEATVNRDHAAGVVAGILEAAGVSATRFKNDEDPSVLTNATTITERNAADYEAHAFWQLRRAAAIRKALAEPVPQEAIDAFKDAWERADRDGQEGHRVEAGLRAALPHLTAKKAADE